MSVSMLNLKSRDYTKFGLCGNPFPYSGVPDEDPEIYVGQEEVINSINIVLSTSVMNKKSNHLIITGTYGNGKSHTLRYIKYNINKKFINIDGSKACAVHISKSGGDFLDIYRELIYDLGYDFIKKRAEEFLGLVACQMSKEGLIDEKVVPEKSWEMICDGTILLSDIVPTAILKLDNIVNFMDFSKAFLNLAYEENSVDSWEWICGEGVDYIKRREIGLNKALDEKNAIRAFIALKKTLINLNYSTLILLLDEFEYVDTLQIVKKQKVLNELRHLIDLNPEGLSTIIACTPEIWQSLISEYHAFSERIAREANLKPLTPETAKKLVSSYLNTKRANVNESLTPFTEDSINEIFRLGHGNTRRILLLCGQTLDLALEFNKEFVDLEVVNSI
ncbi:BREX system ATP-binding domain-containing protein [Methanosarcina sp. Mfa9]|uniref:BREX system ATP-binding domain-containing protein n=1 Tax=Methanosarcina sp. Mfa9 TaxID=3439063 RepID=UPI003F837FA6